MISLCSFKVRRKRGSDPKKAVNSLLSLLASADIGRKGTRRHRGQSSTSAGVGAGTRLTRSGSTWTPRGRSSRGLICRSCAPWHDATPGAATSWTNLVQAGSVGLMKASTRFDPSRGIAFATFVAPSVEGEIRRHLRERGNGVRLPREVQRMSTELGRLRSELAASLGRPPDVRELAAALDADVREVEHLLAADLARDPVALGAGGAVPELPAKATRWTRASIGCPRREVCAALRSPGAPDRLSARPRRDDRAADRSARSASRKQTCRGFWKVRSRS